MNNIDKIFKDNLFNAEEPVPADIWNGVEKRLNKRRNIVWFYRTISAAAILIIAALLFVPDPQNPHKSVPMEELISQNQHQNLLPKEDEPMKKPVLVEKWQNVESIAANAELKQQDKTSSNQVIQEENQEIDTTQEDNFEQPKKQKPRHSVNNNNYDAQVYVDGNGLNLKESTKKRYTFSLASTLLSGNGNTNLNNLGPNAASGSNGTAGFDIEQISDIKYSLPLNFGLQVQLNLSENVALGLGLNYSMYRSKYDGLVYKKMYNIKQTAHYIGVPVNIYAKIIEKNNIFFYGNAGISFDKPINVSYVLESYDITKRGNSSVKGLEISTNLGLGAEFKFTNQLGLYLEPNLVYYTNSKTPRIIRTDQPLQFRVELGFRYHL